MNDNNFNCYKCGRNLNLLSDRFCCRRLQGDIGIDRGKVVKEKKLRSLKRKTKYRKRKNLSEELKYTVLKRDKKKCVKCGSKTNLHIHHIKHVEHGGTNELSNLQTLCDLCHMGEHKNEMVYNLMIQSFWDYKEVKG